jgi:peptide/nickel transport system ATP-binding protein
VSELRFQDLTVRFGTRRRGLTAVDAVNLTVPAGMVVGLVGESGSGKSTLARAAVGLTPVTGGRVLLDGRPPRRTSRGGVARRPVQLVFQDPYSSLDPRMTVGASIAEAIPRGALRGAAARRDEVGRLLELVGLAADRAGEYPAALSGGQRQRVALARALAGRPEVIIADEITSALDVSVQGTVLNLVRDLQRRMRLSMLFISHDLTVVRYVSDVIAVMYLGRIVEYGPAGDVLADPQHPYTRELLAAAPRPGTAPVDLPDPDPALRAVADAEPADPHHPPPGCRFHPRCPIGPLVRDDRETCRETEPVAEGHRHRAACHFADTVSGPHDPNHGPSDHGPSDHGPLGTGTNQEISGTAI